MKKNFYFAVLIIAIFFANSCQNNNQGICDIVSLDIRNEIQHCKNSISLKEDIKEIEYIPLETNNSCLISNVLDMRISDDYIFVYNGKTSDVLQFNRKGKFLRKIGREGNGPGEYNMITELSIDNIQKKLLIFQYSGSFLVYNFNGDFLGSDTLTTHAGGMYVFSDGSKALKGLTMNPIQQAPWAGALTNSLGELVMNESLYPNLSNREVLYMKDICFSPFHNGVLLFTACNDTVYRINPSNIQPVFVLKRSNEPDYYEAVADITRMNDPILNDPNTIGVYDMFETYRYFYVRLYKGDKTYVQRYNKEKAIVESYCIPQDFVECSDAIPGNNILGIENEMAEGIPFWPEFYTCDGSRAQIVSPYALSVLKEKGYLHNISSKLNIKENDNPIVIIYTFKE